MADPAALRDVAKDGFLESREGWKEVPAAFQARALCASGLLEIVIDWLDGASAGKRAGSLVQSSRILDAQVGQSWTDPLSPRIKSWLASLR